MVCCTTHRYLLAKLAKLQVIHRITSGPFFFSSYKYMYGIENECRGIWEIYTSVNECIFSIYHGTRFSVSLRPRDYSCFSCHNLNICAC